MDNQAHAVLLRKIHHILDQEVGFDQVESIYQHYIISDIVWRFSESCGFWTNPEQFTHNYVKWVNKYFYVHFAHKPDKTDMWEHWAKMLRSLILGDN